MNFKDLIKMSKIKSLPFSRYIHKNPMNIGGGIYRMFDEDGTIVYVGKSKDLHRRMRQHFGKDSHTKYFIDEVKEVEIFQESCPVMQTLLEAIFIAYHRPKYNDEVKDNKNESQ